MELDLTLTGWVFPKIGLPPPFKSDEILQYIKDFLYSHPLQKDAIYLLNFGLHRFDHYFQSCERYSGAGFYFTTRFYHTKSLEHGKLTSNCDNNVSILGHLIV